VDQGAATKEAIADLLKWQAANPASDPAEGVKGLGLKMLTQAELDQIVDRHIEKSRKLVEEKGVNAFSSLMGSVMSEVRGSIEPKQVSETLKRKLAEKSAK